MSRPRADDPSPFYEEIKASLPEEKRCGACGVTKEASHFYLCRSGLRIKLQSRCKDCCRARAKQSVQSMKDAGTYEQFLAERRQQYHRAKADDPLHNKKRYNVSLDRIDATMGYAVGNVRLVCVVVNLALNKFGDAVFDEMCEAYIAKKRSQQ